MTRAVDPFSTQAEPLFIDFFYLLREYDIPVSLTEIMDFYTGLEKGLVKTLDELFILMRLALVKRVEHLDSFERAFALYFYDVDLPAVVEGDPELLQTKQFRKWLEQAVERGDIPRHALWSMSRDELMRRFWETVREQMEAHHGGNRWVGTGGTSPYGHSGFAERGIRVHGTWKNRSAIKVIGDRRYVAYDDHHTLSGANLRQALGALKNMVPVGPYDELDLDETIFRTGRNGGEIDLIFKRRELDRLKLILLIDNGGTSMLPFVRNVQTLFSKIKDRFKDTKTYYFHNTIYRNVYLDSRRCQPYPLEKLLLESRDSRVFIIGDASMAPEELLYRHGSIEFEEEDAVASIDRLQHLRDRFEYSVWLNPIPKEEWDITYGRITLEKIREVFFMEDLTLRGIKSAVAWLQAKAAK
ncbi:hypothetical protein SCOR_07005 [Sulfidibacter corallicola]|uniref:VWA domain containing CoxE-like protein n=1 Tax=Sulfidibacter corallicola TaxID=2818388 RepID=A0A8A4TY81_SULCO|nr:hypothetical protein [Sulfidibacter corallicola]QTD51485.1 hypothetical protein J3U87_03365 [Sulfidibacter corallicola]